MNLKGKEWMSLLLESWLGWVYIIYTTNSRTYPVAGVTISSIHCVAYGKECDGEIQCQSPAFNDLMICIQLVKTWLWHWRSSGFLCQVWSYCLYYGAISSLGADSRGLRSLSLWRDDSASPLIASVLFYPCSAARLLLIAPLLPVVGSAANLHVCPPSTTAAAHWHG